MMPAMTRFGTPWDRTLAVSTALIVALFAALGVGIPWLVGREAPEMLGVLLLLPLLLLGILAACWALAPRGFALEAGEVRVERPVLPVSIPLASIRSVQVLGPAALRGSLRLGGTGGLFGYYGRFWSRSLGPYRLYATSARRLVLLDTQGGRFVLSPDPPARFAEAVLARAPRARGDAPLAPAGPLPRRTWLLLAAVAAGVPLALAAVFGLSWAYGPRSAELTGSAIVIERNWAGPVELPLAGVRAVRPLGRADFAGWRRTSGVALGSLAYGRFRSDALGPFRLYAWRRGPLLLLETDEGKVVLSPDDPQRFLDEVRERLAR
jgi:hypothetical protein